MIGRLMRRYPWTGRLLQIGMRLVQPKHTIGVTGVLFDAAQERVLLVEHLFHPRFPWGLPGGWLDRGEDPADTVVREFREETGLRVRAVCPLLVRRASYVRGHMDVVFLCAMDGDDQPVRLNNELISYRWTARDNLPPLTDFSAAGVRAGFEIVGKL